MPVTTEDDLDAPIGRVWDCIADFAGIQRWHPQIVRCECPGNSQGVERRVHFADWWALELLHVLDQENHRLVYIVTDSSRPINIGAVGEIVLTSLAPDRTHIRWTAGLPEDHKDAAVINGALKSYYPARMGHLKAALAENRNVE